MANMRVAVGIDDKFVFPFLTMIFSALKHSEMNFSVIVGFDPNLLHEKNRTLISEILKRLRIDFVFFEVALPSEYKQTTHIPASTFIRLLLADALEETFLWLDCDLICEPGWDRLLNLKSYSTDSIIFAAVDSVVLNLGPSPNKARLLAGSNYFNSGVMVVNARKWNRQGMGLAWRGALAKYEEYHFQFADQCILNFIASDFWTPLDPSFNQLELISRRSNSSTPKIRHFAGPVKPWHYTSEWSPLTLVSPFSRKALSSYFKAHKEFSEFFLAKGWVSEALAESRLRSVTSESKINQARLALALRKGQAGVKRYF